MPQEHLEDNLAAVAVRDSPQGRKLTMLSRRNIRPTALIGKVMRRLAKMWRSARC
jgi:hypothetical protein